MWTGTEDSSLYAALSQYGYSLLQPEENVDPNQLLVKLAKSKDFRLLEGFPVVLANALEKQPDRVNLAAAENTLHDQAARERFHQLVLLSLCLFEVFGLEKLKPAGYAQDAKDLVDLRNQVVHNMPLEMGKGKLDMERVKKTFLRYYVRGHENESAESKAKLREEFRQEYFLSLFFAPKQKDLLKKKLRDEELTKTEREYFSRVVKKKLMALADPDLHRLALKVLQQA
ncbi:MAG: hypothetical protein WC712_13395 [Candidatus Brocadiia bacterium]